MSKKPARKTKVLILTGDHHAPDPTKRDQRYNEEDFQTHNTMVAAFESFSDIAVSVLSDHAKLRATVEGGRPDLVVNFCDTGFFNNPKRELNVPAYLELLEVPYSGAPPQAMVTCYDKQIVRLVADSLGVVTPQEFFLPAGTTALPDQAHFPLLLKPNQADGSVGITKDSVVKTQEDAQNYLAWLGETLPGRDILAQEYLPGPEYGLGLIGNPEDGLTALPALEVDFSRLPKDLAPILSFESKALPDSPYWTDIKFKRAELDPKEEAALAKTARLLFARFGLQDYGRFDFRRGADGVIKLMEVNPNPAWASDGKLAFMAAFAGLDYAQMLRLFLDGALARVKRQQV